MIEHCDVPTEPHRSPPLRQPPAAESFAPLSYAQQRLWLLHRLHPASPAYNVRKALRIEGVLDVAALQAALDDLARRHEILRTTFPIIDGEPVQAIAATLTIPLVVDDLSVMPESQRESEAHRRIHADAALAFDVAAGPLFRGTLFRFDAEHHVLLLAMHHIVFDDGSVPAFNRDLAELYRAHHTGTPSVLEELPIQYADFAVWQRESLHDDALAADLRYWREHLAGAPPTIDVPTDFPRPAVLGFKGSAVTAVLPLELAEALRTLSLERGTTLFMTLLAALNVLLYRYTGQSDLVVGLPIANRTRTELESLIGFFINTLPLRTRVDDSMRFEDVLAGVRESAISAYDHQDIPFERLVEELEPKRSRGIQPLVNIMFFVRSKLGEPLALPGLRLSSYPLESASARFDLTLRVAEVTAGLECSLQYDTHLFERRTIERMVRHFSTLLHTIVETPEISIAELPILSPAERHQILVEWNDTAAPYDSERPLHRIFEEQVDRSPDAIAVTAGNVELTYGELNVRANRLARTLRAQGMACGSIVGICTERNLEMIVGVLAVLKAGAAYLPLDPRYPLERLRYMLADANVRGVLLQHDLFDRLDRSPAFAIIGFDAGEHGASENLPSVSVATDPAYVMYTSGTMGRPKGVIVPQRAVCRLVTGTNYVTIGASDTIAQVASFSFDAATFEIWGALLNGARLYIVPRHVILEPVLFEECLKRHHISIMFLTAALFRMTSAQRPAAFETLACLIVGGETVDPASVRAVLQGGPPLRLLNGYGPTEVTTFACTYEITAPPAGPVPIGRPIANTEAYILDGQLNAVPVGVRGQLYLGGPGLALGYIGDDELTARKFVPHPFRREPESRLYATGDLARFLPSGDIDFLGRSDRQVKIRGFRIELDEIEAALRALPTVREAAVCVRESVEGERLVAYVVDEAVPPRSSVDWRRLLGKALPEYMVPNAVIAVPHIALSVNGKVDIEALPDVAMSSSQPPDAPAVTLTHHQLIGLWADLLDTRNIGLSDNFFDLGGHSLLTMRMLTEVKAIFSASVSLTAFLEEPTVAHLATLIPESKTGNVATEVVELQSDGSATPLFFFHGDLWGGGYYVRRLARLLGVQRPVYVISPQGVAGSRLCATVEEMAGEYVTLLKRIRPQGPYLVGGFCSGGLVAFELARVLQAQGERVAEVLLVDAPGANGRLASLLEPLDWVSSVFRLGCVGRAVSDKFAVFANTVHRATRFLRRTRAAVSSGDATSVWSTVLCRLFRDRGRARPEPSLEDVWRRLTDRYVPRRYDGRVTLLVPQLDRAERSTSRRGWRAVTSQLTVHTVPGEHLTCITRYLDRTALRIREVLDGADARRGA